jgi:enoyl-CoA hydratase/carnithine racemase
VDEHVAELSLARPEPPTEWLFEALQQALETGARAVLVDATGTLPEAATWDAAVLRDITLFELPLVCAFETELRGSWTDLALAADIRICGDVAALRGRLSKDARARTLADDATALELYLGRTPIEANRLLEAGLVSEVAAAGGALGAARRVADVVASRGPIATRLGKEAIWRGLAQPLDQALRFETDLTLLLQTTKDRAEGVRAFLEKRPPKFTGE